jgi:hypothetical protein
MPAGRSPTTAVSWAASSVLPHPASASTAINRLLRLSSTSETRLRARRSSASTFVTVSAARERTARSRRGRAVISREGRSGRSASLCCRRSWSPWSRAVCASLRRQRRCGHALLLQLLRWRGDRLRCQCHRQWQQHRHQVDPLAFSVRPTSPFRPVFDVGSAPSRRSGELPAAIAVGSAQQPVCVAHLRRRGLGRAHRSRSLAESPRVRSDDPRPRRLSRGGAA